VKRWDKIERETNGGLLDRSEVDTVSVDVSYVFALSVQAFPFRALTSSSLKIDPTPIRQVVMKLTKICGGVDSF
jgi:hypothetical protein